MVETNGNSKATATRNDAALSNVFGSIAAQQQTPFAIDGAGHLGLAKSTLEFLYRSPILKRLCRARPDAAILRGWQVTLGGQKGKQKIVADVASESERLKVPQAFNRAQVWANLYGGAAIVINADDGEHWSKPINLKKLKRIKGLRVLDRHKISPLLESTDFDPLEPKYYQLTLGIQTLQTLGFDGKNIDLSVERPDIIHHSRIVRFDGIELPPDMCQYSGGWGQSVIEEIWDEYSDWKGSLKSMSKILKDFSVFIYKVSELGTMLDDHGEDALRTRFTAFKQGIETLGAAAIDKEGEDVDYKTRTLGGIDAIADKLRDALIGASGLPHTKLFGASPSGLGATGESEANNWADEVQAFQQSQWYNKLRALIRLIFLSSEGPTKGKEPEDWSIRFFSLIQQSESDLAGIRSTQATTDNTYVGAGILLPEEVRQSRFGGSEYSSDTILDSALWKKTQEANASEFGEFGGGEEAPPTEVVEEVPPEELPTNQDSWLDAIDFTPPVAVQKTPPVAVQKAAKRGLALREKYQRGGMSTVEAGKEEIGSGVARAVSLSKGQSQSPETISKMVSFFARHEKNKASKAKDGTPGAGAIAWLLWGGDPGRRWAESLKSQIDRRMDSAPSVKRQLKWQGLNLGITHEPGDYRFPYGSIMQSSYGHLRGSYGHAPDGKAFDFYIGSNPEVGDLYKVRQIDPITGMFDEDKYFAGFESPEEVRRQFVYHAGRERFGGIERCDPSELKVYRTDTYHRDSSECECAQCQVRQRKKRRRKAVVPKVDADDGDVVDAIVEKAVEEGDEILADWLGGIKEWMKSCSSLEEVKNKITEAYEITDGEKLTSLLENINLLADLTGEESI